MKLVFLSSARQDIIEILTYIKNDLNNPPAALNFRNSIAKRSQALLRFPKLGATLGKTDNRFQDYRYLVLENYLLIYAVTEEEIRVLRVLYARSDYMRLLQG